ncbi:branched-chain amino acid ABC transporter permease [Ruminococcus sp. OA3]|uniref:branched-chain amino acid ABC transporter permease n=1 Tax=Ruminococcus sp. OA3 TaxID=2914164 RepID=UPI001F057CEC|nr:branched-chain amino acid ABC transporter permease [Ruminococcus sp. OA3]MCH1982248.1 branched-chain amino acid ABC transporter permease [Ruminococcus sp. OA3]
MKENKLSKFSAILGKVGLSPVSLLAFIVLALSPMFAGNEYNIRLLLMCVMYGTLAMGFDLSAGYIGVANWGYAALMGLGGYTSALLFERLGVSPWIGMICAGLIATFAGLLIGLLTLRMDGMFAALLAWFVGLILMNAANAMTGLTRGALGLQVQPLFDTPWATPYFYVIFTICVITYIVLRVIVKSNLGLAFTALGQDMQTARTTGVSPLKYRLINFCISCFIAGIVGGFYAHYIGILTPTLMATKGTIQILVIAYFGGRGSIWGPLLAAFITMPIFESMNSLVELKYIIYGLVLILIMIFMPNGIAGFGKPVKEFIRKRIAKKDTKK